MAYSNLILRMELEHRQIRFGEVAAAIGMAGGDVTSIDVIHSGKDKSIRDITVDVSDAEESRIVDSLRQIEGLHIVNVSDRTFLAHLGGKIRISPSMPIKNRDDLSRVYTPGVAKVCMAISEQPDKAFSLTIKRNTVAVISDGSAVLGLGNIGPLAAAPVMEGKAMLFKQLAGVDAFPICLNSQDTEEIVRTIKSISPIFGGINLEDISSPRCFEIEQRLAGELDIPVFHDDQHGTAIVVVAGLLNALKVVRKRMEEVRVVVNGIGAAGAAICKMLLAAGVTRLVPVDKNGAIVRGKSYSHPVWHWLSEQPQVEDGEVTLKEAICGADVFIGVSRGKLLTSRDVENMADRSIVFAMANPEPEISPEEALPHVGIYASGRSDYPNQINNVLVFPGLFRGLLDCRARSINESMKLVAAQAIASVVTEDERNEHYIIPSIFNEQVVSKIRQSVIETAIATDVARRIPKDFRA